ncbi:MAG: nuclear transport factor 2 family protein, partial [Roseiflexaceae bacterium]
IVQLFGAIDALDWADVARIVHPEILYERSVYEPFKNIERLLHFYRNEGVLASGKHSLERIVRNGDHAACWGRFVRKKRDKSDVDELFADCKTFEGGRSRTRGSFSFGLPFNSRRK